MEYGPHWTEEQESAWREENNRLTDAEDERIRQEDEATCRVRYPEIIPDSERPAASARLHQPGRSISQAASARPLPNSERPAAEHGPDEEDDHIRAEEAYWSEVWGIDTGRQPSDHALTYRTTSVLNDYDSDYAEWAYYSDYDSDYDSDYGSTANCSTEDPYEEMRAQIEQMGLERERLLQERDVFHTRISELESILHNEPESRFRPERRHYELRHWKQYHCDKGLWWQDSQGHDFFMERDCPVNGWELWRDGFGRRWYSNDEKLVYFFVDESAEIPTSGASADIPSSAAAAA